MEVFITRPKYVPETITISADFSLVFPSSVTVTGIPTVTVTLEIGTDATPSNILYGGISVSNNLVVSQKIRLGIPGNIYSITFTTSASDGNTYELTTRLAIIPNEGDALPTWLPLWELTQLYPIQIQEFITGSLTFQDGTLQVIVIPYSYSESLKGTSTFDSGILTTIVVTYSYTESLQGSSNFVSGTLVVVVIPYSYYESLKGSSAFLSGTLVVVVVPYSYTESLQGSATFVSGTLL